VVANSAGGGVEPADSRRALCNQLAFVHGGDLFDRGPGDIRLSRLLVDFKQRHPSRVFLLMGNRDINKIRFLAEFAFMFHLAKVMVQVVRMTI
jgi:hypothetical protein